MSSSNEGRTEGDISLMGLRLANEVDHHINRNYGNILSCSSSGLKISFIGHSMGGLIIRSALPKL